MDPNGHEHYAGAAGTGPSSGSPDPPYHDGGAAQYDYGYAHHDGQAPPGQHGHDPYGGHGGYERYDQTHGQGASNAAAYYQDDGHGGSNMQAYYHDDGGQGMSGGAYPSPHEAYSQGHGGAGAQGYYPDDGSQGPSAAGAVPGQPFQQPNYGHPYMTPAPYGPQNMYGAPAADGYYGQAYMGYPPGADAAMYMGGYPDLQRAPSVAGSMHSAGMMSPSMGPTRPVAGGLARQGTTLSSMTMSSSLPARGVPLKKSTGSSTKDSNPGLPFTKQFVEEYRQRMKGDPDPEAQFGFAKYLIEAAKKVKDSDTDANPKAARKYRDALLVESIKLIKRLATTGMSVGKPPYAEAQFFLANCFGNGSLGLQVDHEKAYNLYVQASKQNHPAATYRTAVCNEIGAGTKRDHHRAVLFFRKASALGDTAGMYKLGMILLNGLLGQERNPKEAIVWLKRAAGQADEDNPHALHELGLLHERANNNIVPHDEAHARELFTQAAQLGYAPAQFKLGTCYEYGSLTCPVDPRRSIAWYTRAAGKHHGDAELALSGWYLTGSEGVLKQSDSEAYLWARRAATKGLPKAEYAVGYYTEVGIGIKQDLDEAKRWYMRAAAQGNKRAMARLTELKKMGNKPGKRGARPTRKDTEGECVIC